ncbi:DHHA1 domain protein [Melia azedarach]|uniref:DHHA1 domain protein n=1 Tax=Melia azedarach TaxID=155640 RepID=A0ACC1XQ34_MELAZ|nr:DHHA1 domain protein [Melia azedarach]
MALSPLLPPTFTFLTPQFLLCSFLTLFTIPSPQINFPCMKLMIFTYLILWVLLVLFSKFSPKVSRVVILDHHKTALEAKIEGENVVKVLDMERSGATIAYDYFKEKILDKTLHREFERVRLLFDYIEDGDLWRWRLENSKSFSSGLKDLNIEFSFQLNPSLFEQLLSLDLESIISHGMVSLSHKQRLIEGTLNQSYKIALGGGAFGHCLAVDADAVAELRSELGHQLANKSRDLKLRGIGAVVYRVPELQNDQVVKISLRSLDNEDTSTYFTGIWRWWTSKCQFLHVKLCRI